MPPHSKVLAEEGATFKSFKLVKQGNFDEKGESVSAKFPVQYNNTLFLTGDGFILSAREVFTKILKILLKTDEVSNTFIRKVTFLNETSCKKTRQNEVKTEIELESSGPGP